jgi:hypothetical protein
VLGLNPSKKGYPPGLAIGLGEAEKFPLTLNKSVRVPEAALRIIPS